MSSYGVGGTQRVIADIVIGTSGQPVRIYSITLSSGATASELTLRNGTTATDTIFWEGTGTANTGVTINLGETGLFFPAGCFADVDANIVYATISYTQEVN